MAMVNVDWIEKVLGALAEWYNNRRQYDVYANLGTLHDYIAAYSLQYLSLTEPVLGLSCNLQSS